MAKAVNKNQSIILKALNDARGSSLTATLAGVSLNEGVPLSTLKLNARILKDLDPITVRDTSVFLTESGPEALSLLELSGAILPSSRCELGCSEEVPV